MINWLIRKITRPLANAFTRSNIRIYTHYESLPEELLVLKFIMDNVLDENKKSEVRSRLHVAVMNNTLHRYCSTETTTIANHIELIKELKKYMRDLNKLCKKESSLAIMTRLEMYIQPLSETINKIEETLQ